MRKAIAVLAFVSGSAVAAPFVVADVVSGVASCRVFVENVAVTTLVTAANLQCKYDVGSISVGAHTVQMTAIATGDPVWGTQESAKSLPLSFTRPATPQTPSTPRLTAQ